MGTGGGGGVSKNVRRGWIRSTLVKEGSHVSILVEAVRVMGKDEGIVHMEKGEIGCVGIEWEEE